MEIMNILNKEITNDFKYIDDNWYTTPRTLSDSKISVV